jgi:MoaA/NifB/PqqE/SkfB family radical SAM enzyme
VRAIRDALHSEHLQAQQKMSVVFVAPAWLVVGTRGAVEVRELDTGTPMHIEGGLAERVLAGDAQGLGALAQLNPTLARFASDLARARPVPLTRDAVLRGGGFRQLYIELSSRCNEQCVHCYAEAGPRSAAALAEAEVERVLQDARSLGFRVVQLTGGDPLIAPTFPTALERAKALGFETVEVYTNGLALRGELFELIRALRPDLAFSLYSYDPAEHDAITRTPGSQARTVQAIRAVVEAGLSVRVNIIALETNRHSVERTAEFLRGLGVPREAIGADVQRGVGRGIFDEGSLDWLAPMHRAAAPEPRSDGAASTRFGGTACVASDGTVYPCIFSRSLPLGSVRATSLREVLEARVPLEPAFDDEPEALRGELACHDCRVRASLLGGSKRLMNLRVPARSPAGSSA